MEHTPPSYAQRIKKGGWEIAAEKNVSDVLVEGGLELRSVSGII